MKKQRQVEKIQSTVQIMKIVVFSWDIRSEKVIKFSLENPIFSLILAAYRTELVLKLSLLVGLDVHVLAIKLSFQVPDLFSKCEIGCFPTGRKMRITSGFQFQQVNGARCLFFFAV